MSQGSTAQEPIFSTYQNDADLSELVAMFVEEMPDRVTALVEAFDGNDLNEVRRLAHQLKGASGSYGFPQLTEPAARLEQTVRDAASVEETEAAFRALVGFCNRIA